MRNAPATRRAITFAAALLLGASYGPTSSAQTHDPQLGICANGDAQSRVTACSQLLGRSGLDTATRIAAYVNRGNAHDAADQFDLALKDYQSALDLDSNNWPALRSRAGSVLPARPACRCRKGSLPRRRGDAGRGVAAAAAGTALRGDGPDGSRHRGLQQGPGSEPRRSPGAAGARARPRVGGRPRTRDSRLQQGSRARSAGARGPCRSRIQPVPDAPVSAGDSRLGSAPEGRSRTAADHLLPRRRQASHRRRDRTGRHRHRASAASRCGGCGICRRVRFRADRVRTAQAVTMPRVRAWPSRSIRARRSRADRPRTG